MSETNGVEFALTEEAIEWSPLHEAWVTVLGGLEELTATHEANVQTDRGSYTYRYADLADVLGYIRPVLREAGLAISQSVTGEAGRSIAVETIVWHPSGETLRFGPLAFKAEGGPQNVGGAIAYARRYALMAALGLATEDDDARGAQAATQGPMRGSEDRAPRGNRPDRPASTFRTREEAEIRGLLSEQDEQVRKEVQDAFKEEFGCTLTDLRPADHQRALEYVKWLLAPEQRGEPVVPEGSG